jgi:hypothetical protein
MRGIRKAIMVLSIPIFIFSMVSESLALTNLALGGTATQSTTYMDDTISYGAYLGIDGIVSDLGSNDGLTHTKREVNAWWQVDLGDDYNISKIDIYNRSADYSWRINPSFIYIIKDGSPVWTDEIDDTGVAYNWTFLTPKVGRIVKIQLNQSNDPYLHMKEVEVWGDAQTCTNGDCNPSPCTNGNCQSVPEPNTILLLGLGLIGLVRMRRK